MTTLHRQPAASRRHPLAFVLLCALAGASAHAQEQGPRKLVGEDSPRATPALRNSNGGHEGGKFAHMPCPKPIHKVLVAPSITAPTPTPVLSDFPAGWNVAGSMWNHTTLNTHFGHTFTFEPPKGMCCQASDGQLRVTYRALSRGSSHESSDAGNDGGGPVRNGQGLNNMQPGGYGHIWPNSGVAAGTVVTHTYTIPASWIASGRVSFGAQDDSSVIKAELVIRACCLTPTPSEK